MIADSFIDTNILVYAVDPDIAVNSKHLSALEILERTDIGISTQVLEEFYTVATRKLKCELSTEDLVSLIEAYMVLPIVIIDQMIVLEGIHNSIKYQISYWDGAIIAAAERLQCKTLYTEDLNHGQMYGSVKAINPFI